MSSPSLTWHFCDNDWQLETIKIRLSYQLKRALCSFHNLLFQIFKISCHPATEYSILFVICHATETDLKMELAEFQHKPANKFSQKRNFIVLNWKQFSRLLFSNRLLEVLVLRT